MRLRILDDWSDNDSMYARAIMNSGHCTSSVPNYSDPEIHVGFDHDDSVVLRRHAH